MYPVGLLFGLGFETATELSVAAALIIGTVELLSVWVHELSLKGRVWDAVSNLNLNTVGFVIVGLFGATWLIAIAVWRFARIEARWSGAITPHRSEPCTGSTDRSEVRPTRSTA